MICVHWKKRHFMFQRLEMSKLINKNIQLCISKDEFDVMVGFFLWLKNVRDREFSAGVQSD